MDFTLCSTLVFSCCSNYLYQANTLWVWLDAGRLERRRPSTTGTAGRDLRRKKEMNAPSDTYASGMHTINSTPIGGSTASLLSLPGALLPWLSARTQKCTASWAALSSHELFARFPNPTRMPDAASTIHSISPPNLPTPHIAFATPEATCTACWTGNQASEASRCPLPTAAWELGRLRLRLKLRPRSASITKSLS